MTDYPFEDILFLFLFGCMVIISVPYHFMLVGINKI